MPNWLRDATVLVQQLNLWEFSTTLTTVTSTHFSRLRALLPYKLSFFLYFPPLPLFSFPPPSAPPRLCELLLVLSSEVQEELGNTLPLHASKAFTSLPEISLLLLTPLLLLCSSRVNLMMMFFCFWTGFTLLVACCYVRYSLTACLNYGACFVNLAVGKFWKTCQKM